MVIVETRPTRDLLRVISEAVTANPGWGLYVFGPSKVHDFLDFSKVTGYTRVVLGCESMDTHEYSKLLLSNKFWDLIREEHVLVFQTDCVIVRGVPPSFLAFDYVGALCGLLAPDAFIMNGGLSLRRRSAMLRAAAAVEGLGLSDEPEDVAFCRAMRRLGGFTIPSMAECDAFAIESQGDPATAIGAHGIDKGYAPPGLLRALVDLASA